jgi:hypothetical protein
VKKITTLTTTTTTNTTTKNTSKHSLYGEDEGDEKVSCGGIIIRKQE